MIAKEYPEGVAGGLSVLRISAHETVIEFSHSIEFQDTYLKCLEIGQQVRVPLYTTPPSIEALIAGIESIVKCAETAMDGDTGDTIYIGEAYPEDDVKDILDKYRSKP